MGRLHPLTTGALPAPRLQRLVYRGEPGKASVISRPVGDLRLHEHAAPKLSVGDVRQAPLLDGGLVGCVAAESSLRMGRRRSVLREVRLESPAREPASPHRLADTRPGSNDTAWSGAEPGSALAAAGRTGWTNVGGCPLLPPSTCGAADRFALNADVRRTRDADDCQVENGHLKRIPQRTAHIRAQNSRRLPLNASRASCPHRLSLALARPTVTRTRNRPCLHPVASGS